MNNRCSALPRSRGSARASRGLPGSFLHRPDRRDGCSSLADATLAGSVEVFMNAKCRSDAFGIKQTGDRMSDSNPQVPWTEEQWARANRVIQEEGSRARVGRDVPAADRAVAGRTPISSGPRRSTTAAPAATQDNHRGQHHHQLATLQVKVFLRGAQMADPDMSSALQLFRRAANLLARQEDTIVFRGQRGRGNVAPAQGSALRRPCRHARCSAASRGPGSSIRRVSTARTRQARRTSGEHRVRTHRRARGSRASSDRSRSCSGMTSSSRPRRPTVPWCCRRIGSSLSSAAARCCAPRRFRRTSGVVVALGGAPVDLVIAKDMSLNFLQVTDEPHSSSASTRRWCCASSSASAIVSLRRTARSCGRGQRLDPQSLPRCATA